MVTKKTKKERFHAFVYAAIASAPLGLWLLGTKLNWETTARSHYFNLYKGDMESKVGLKFIPVIWRTAFMSLMQLPGIVKATYVRLTSRAQADALTSALAVFNNVNMWIAGLSCLVAFVWGVIKRNWELLALILYLILFSCVHAFRRAVHARYAVPMIWVVLLISCCGIKYCWSLVNLKNWMPKAIKIVFQVVIIVIFSIWLFRIIPFVPETFPRCTRGASLPYVTMGVIGLVVLIEVCFFKSKFLVRNLALTAFVFVIVISQHFSMARQVGNGSYNIEFKRLVDWYVENAKPGERLASTWTGTLRTIAPKYKKNFIPLTSMRGKTLEKVLQNCYKNDLTYITWTSRGSNSSKKGVAMLGGRKMSGGNLGLSNPSDHGPCIFLKRIQSGSKRWINVFKLQYPPPPEYTPTEDDNDKKKKKDKK
jgi:hypothetical protein